MTAFTLLIVCLLLGAAVNRYAHPPIGLAAGLNWWLINIALPAMILELVPRLQFDLHLIYLVLSQWLIFAAAWGLFTFVGKRLRWSRARTGAMILVAGLGNTSFIGYPLVEALRGREGLALAVIADQGGCFIALAVGGVVVSALYSGQQPKLSHVVRRVLLFPAFLALVAGIAVGALGGWPDIVADVLQRIAQTLTPLALFVVGLRFHLHLGRDRMTAVGLGVVYKLALVPALILGIGLLCGVRGLPLTIAVLQAAMAPMVSAAILADQHNLDPPVANTLLGAGTLLSFATVPLWNFALG
ncbi:MAG: AEC family transporter [Solimonas sp.]